MHDSIRDTSLQTSKSIFSKSSFHVTPVQLPHDISATAH